jgi:tetratricopeptide (TPR) repeat protein
MKHSPESAEAAYALGKALHQLKEFRKAEQALLESARLDPKYAPPHYALSRLYMAAGRAGEAAKAMDAFRRLEGAGRKSTTPLATLSSP